MCVEFQIKEFRRIMLVFSMGINVTLVWVVYGMEYVYVFVKSRKTPFLLYVYKM